MKQMIKELWIFGLKQANACIFGGFLLAVMVLTKLWYPLESVHRYDFIFLSAVAFQLLLLVFKLETLRESLVIVVFSPGGNRNGAIQDLRCHWFLDVS